MVYVFFKARFQLAVLNEEIHQGKYTYFSNVTQRMDKREALQRLNNLMRHGDSYDVICLGPQEDGTLDMLAVFKQRTDVVSIDRILQEEYEFIWKKLQVSYEDSLDEDEMDYHAISVVDGSVETLTWEDAAHRISESTYVENRGDRCDEYFLNVVLDRRYKNDRQSAVRWEMRKCGINVQYKDNAEALAETLLAGPSFMAELDRIYDPVNAKEFHGIPVHYQLTVENSQAADMYIDLLVGALYGKKRILSDQITYLKIDPRERRFTCVDDELVNKIMKGSYGGVIVLEMNWGNGGENTKSIDDEIRDYFSTMIFQYRRDIVFILLKHSNSEATLDTSDCNSQAKLNIVNINEGYGSREEAVELLQILSKESDFAQYVSDEDFQEMLPEGDQFTSSDIYTIFEYWMDNVMKDKVYSSYKNIQSDNEFPAEKYIEKENDPYVELQEMVGLEKTKAMIDDILMGQELRALKKSRGFQINRGANHILFTGNPGSAKTTVARLIARILFDRGVTTNPRLVECGRGDLIAQYVGQTALKVRKAFERAAGGVLFIDEAYSLVDDRRGSFGDEAIATIVQEMENKRNNVTVIFAGYKQPMEKFFQVNEGLRSRIGFHIDFPDYNADELTAIIKLMASRQSYVISGKAIERCHEIFDRASQNEEFGNGRFARNLLEQAIIHQARRLLASHKNDKESITDKELSQLELEDFDVNAVEQYKKQSRLGIGFIA